MKSAAYRFGGGREGLAGPEHSIGLRAWRIGSQPIQFGNVTSSGLPLAHLRFITKLCFLLNFCTPLAQCFSPRDACSRSSVSLAPLVFPAPVPCPDPFPAMRKRKRSDPIHKPPRGPDDTQPAPRQPSPSFRHIVPAPPPPAPAAHPRDHPALNGDDKPDRQPPQLGAGRKQSITPLEPPAATPPLTPSLFAKSSGHPSGNESAHWPPYTYTSPVAYAPAPYSQPPPFVSLPSPALGPSTTVASGPPNSTRYERILPKTLSSLPAPASSNPSSSNASSPSVSSGGLHPIHPATLPSPHHLIVVNPTHLPPHHVQPVQVVYGSPQLYSTNPSTADQREMARKVSHSAIERRRRERINDKIMQLKQLIPTCADQDHLHKLSILESAIAYIRYLQSVVDEKYVNASAATLKRQRELEAEREKEEKERREQLKSQEEKMAETEREKEKEREKERERENGHISAASSNEGSSANISPAEEDSAGGLLMLSAAVEAEGKEKEG
ncbi:uncharacterized protein VTP21DRAFT_1336 [Calcarisporiella thermophila]|uniref:uncharacterized protein n=1 Tax=Calcarisporiella thermophila TaxID=911321 RepID=UPI003743FB07